ncbi:MAG: DNA mismatch repair protein MutS [Clostridiales bacterium]|jgi:DNA mismatch repair protein MutS|nr:DNA mismatch repair protein MutS [Clostridiales bacterium]
MKVEQYKDNDWIATYTGNRDLSGLTPMFRQYLEIRAQVPDCILLYRLGDFYEMFFADAVTVSAELDMVLTGRDGGLQDRIDMCGMPQVACETYISRLIAKGYKVAICEQGTPEGKGLVKRDIVRIITQGTVVEPSMLNAETSNYLCCVYGIDSNNCVSDAKGCNLAFGVAWADLSTGQFSLQVCHNETKLQDLLSSIRPKEVICNDATLLASVDWIVVKSGDCPRLSKYHDWAFEMDAATTVVRQQLSDTLFDKVKQDSLAVCAIGALLEYINQSHKKTVAKVQSLTVNDDSQYMLLNHYTKRTLELVGNMRDGGKSGTLNKAINIANTDMGKRKFTQWILHPLCDCNAINVRLDAVDMLTRSLSVTDGLTIQLKNVKDIERIAMRIQHRNIRPQDLIVLSQSLGRLDRIVELLYSLKSVCGDTSQNKLQISVLDDFQGNEQRLSTLAKTISLHTEVCQLINRAIVPDPALRPIDGNVVADGYNAELDSLRSIKNDSTKIIASIESKERQSTGIKKLKIGYNKITGYYIEIPRNQSNLVPYGYIRKQTMSNVERYITEDIKEIESKILSAQDSIIRLEVKLYDELLDRLVSFVSGLLNTADMIAELDCYVAMSNCAIKYGYTRPQVVSGTRQLEILEGRHPIVEHLIDKFVPNDTRLDINNRTMIVTGPNMSGKSVYMRQVALIVLMAQMGSFVPAKSCTLSPLSGIFARLGSGDDMLSGRSTFMVEMTELANILSYANDNSLILLDELGRGTATYDGISIAKAVVEYFASTKAWVLFSTHYHELTQLDYLPSCHNYQMTVQDDGDKITFVNKLAKGYANKSFGIQVAALSGIPQDIIQRAKVLLQETNI